MTTNLSAERKLNQKEQMNQMNNAATKEQIYCWTELLGMLIFMTDWLVISSESKK